MRILITGINGFIGTHLTEHLLEHTESHIQGFDLYDDNMGCLLEHPRLSFKKGDIFQEGAWLEEQIESSDAVLPLAGIAKPAYYIKKPLWTFELDFEQNAKIVKWCAKYNKRIIFPSTSEVYGLGASGVFREDDTPLVTGPIAKTRWIYSCCKQMLDRLIFAYGEEKGLRFSIFRPFNWVGPRLDSFKDAEKNSARVVTQMIYDILYRGGVTLVDGGKQKRSFTWIGDAVEGLAAIVVNRDGRADGQIFNIGNPENQHSIRELALLLIEEMKGVPVFREKASQAILRDTPAMDYYGKTYDDMQDRVPSVEKMERLMGWRPKTPMRDLVRKTVAYYAAPFGEGI